MDRNYTGPCSDNDVAIFFEHVSRQMLQVNALMAMNSILMLVMVGIGAYGHRYRHHPLTHFLFTCANVLFLPVVSYVVSTVNGQATIGVRSGSHKIVMAYCNTPMIEVLIWTALVQIVGINTITVVASDDREEGRNIAPPTVLLVQVLWTFYLAITILMGNHKAVLLALPPFTLMFAKLIIKCYAWCKARRSLGLGRNPRIIVGYMEQLLEDSSTITQHHGGELSSDQHIPPPLIVAGEDTVLAEKQPRGYSFRWMSNDTGDRARIINNNNLVSIDMVWQLEDALVRSTTAQLKDLCFSFALFKLLWCRFARYMAAEAGFTKARNFLWRLLLEERGDERIFVIVADELSFLQDYYYSSLPMSYSKSCLPILTIFFSLLSIGYCLLAFDIKVKSHRGRRPWQMLCFVQCNTVYIEDNTSRTATYFGTRYFGNEYYILLLLYLLYALVVLAEVKEIVSYICSNWTKVALICRYVNHASWRRSLAMQRCIGLMLRCRCKMTKHWEDKMNQCSIMVVQQHPRRTPVVVALLRRLVHLPEQNTEIPRAVKAAVVDALRRMSSMETSLRRIRNPELKATGANNDILWTINDAKGVADTILVCHIATSVLEARSSSHQHQHQHPRQSLCVDHKIAAIHLSRYCAYLVAYCPGLLPDDDKWCKSLYKAVKKDADRVLAGATDGVEYEKLVRNLRDGPSHEVLKNGAEVGKRLAEQLVGEGDDHDEEETAAAAWELLARFWSEMILYVPPSDNINGHAEAIARGGELITLLWALLAHLGIVSRTHDGHS